MTVNYVNEYTFSERSMRQKRGLFHEGTEEKCCEIVNITQLGYTGDNAHQAEK